MKINFAWQQKLILAALIISTIAGLYFSFWTFVFVGADALPGQHLDRTPGNRYLNLAAADWLLVIILFYWLLRRAEKAAIQKKQDMRASASQNTQESGSSTNTIKTMP